MTWENVLYAFVLLAIGFAIGLYVGIIGTGRIVDDCSRTGQLFRYATGCYKVWRVEDEPPPGSKWKI